MKTNPLKDQIQSLVDTFVLNLETLVRKAALEAISDALGGSSSSVTARSESTAIAAPRATRGRPRKVSAEPKAATGGKRRRRSADQLGAVADRIHAYVSQNPGKRAEEIKAALKIAGSDWPRPVQLLLSQNRLSVKGAKRATTYTARSK